MRELRIRQATKQRRCKLAILRVQIGLKTILSSCNNRLSVYADCIHKTKSWHAHNDFVAITAPKQVAVDILSELNNPFSRRLK